MYAIFILLFFVWYIVSIIHVSESLEMFFIA